jgi:hypothetical protein
MGSFDFRCCVTGLPIRASDPIKYILLTENPYDDSDSIINMHDLWFPRTWPLRAEYNDYGSIDEFDASSPGVWAVIEGLKRDLVEVGTGDNSCHDVPTQKGMDFNDTLNAVQEGRVLVARNYYRKVEKVVEEIAPSIAPSIQYKSPEGLPTLQGIRAFIEEKGFKLSASYGEEGYLVDELETGWVRIRESSYGAKRESLEKLLPSLQQKFAAMITSGSGHYADDGEIQVMPLPNKEHIAFRRKDPQTPLKVYQGMILGAAWDAILQNEDYAKTRAEVQELWEEALKPCSSLELLMRSMERGNGSYASSVFHRSVVPSAMGLSEHMRLIADRHRETPFTRRQMEDFLDDATGMICLQYALSAYRYWWKPSWYGGQGSDYREERKWHLMLANVCKNLHAKLEGDEDEEVKPKKKKVTKKKKKV